MIMCVFIINSCAGTVGDRIKERDIIPVVQQLKKLLTEPGKQTMNYECIKLI